MGFRFQKRVKILPGVTLNLSKGGVSLSTGVRGAHASIGTKGLRGTLGLPGTGCSYSKYKSWKSMGGSAASGRAAARTGRPAARTAGPSSDDREKLTLGFFRRLLLSGTGRHMVDGLMALLEGDMSEAKAQLAQATDIPDGAFTLGCLRLQDGEFDLAQEAFALCERKIARLGEFYRKYDLALTLDLDITEFAGVEATPGEYALRLGQVECLQGQGKIPEAIAELQRMLGKYPGDLTVLLSVAELVVCGCQGDKGRQEWLIGQLSGIANDSDLHANLLLYKAQAQAELGLFEAAAATLTATLRKTANRDPELLFAMRCQRAMYWRELGKTAQFEKELELLRGERPDLSL